MMVVVRPNFSIRVHPCPSVVKNSFLSFILHNLSFSFLVRFENPTILFFELAPVFHQPIANIDAFASQPSLFSRQKIAFFVKIPFLRNGNCQFSALK